VRNERAIDNYIASGLTEDLRADVRNESVLRCRSLRAAEDFRVSVRNERGAGLCPTATTGKTSARMCGMRESMSRGSESSSGK